MSQTTDFPGEPSEIKELLCNGQYITTSCSIMSVFSFSPKCHNVLCNWQAKFSYPLCLLICSHSIYQNGKKKKFFVLAYILFGIILQFAI